jgi:hypothetical protein
MIAGCIPVLQNPSPLPHAVPAVAAALDAGSRISNCMRLCDLPFTPWRQVYVWTICSVFALRGSSISVFEFDTPCMVAMRTLLQNQALPDEDLLLEEKVGRLALMIRLQA